MCIHAFVCVCTNLGEYVQMSADVHTSGKTDEDDRCECIRAWVCVCACVCVCGRRAGGNSCVHDGNTSNRHGSTMTPL